MKKQVEYMLLRYDKYIVEEVYTFADVKQLKQHLITLLQHPAIDNVNSLSREKIIKHVDDRWNYVDGDFWQLSYKIEDDGVGRMMFRSKSK